MPDINRRQLLAGTATVAGGLVLGGATGVRPANAAAMPQIFTRARWGARPPRRPASIIDKPDHLVVHHTASDNTTDYSLAQAFALSRAIQNHHMDDNGWSDTGQQLTISRGGYLMEGRNRTLEALGQGLNVLGAQTANHNSHTLGIENEGIYVDANPTQMLWDSLVVTLAWLCELYDLDPHESIVGHRDYVATQCPGDVFYARLPELRNDVAAGLGLPAREPTTPPVDSGLPMSSEPFDHGPAVGARERRP